MISKNQLKLIRSLRLHKFRETEGLFVAEGVKLVDELLKSNFVIRTILAIPEWIAAGHIPPGRNHVEMIEITLAELEKITALGTPNQVLAVAVIPGNQPVPDISEEWVLVLDQIKDPGNFGTIIRTADWFGIHRIVAAPNSVEIWNPKVVQASMGSVFRVPVHYLGLADFLSEHHRKIPVYGTLLEGEIPAHISLAEYGIVVIGNESHGISESIKSLITTRITIPAAPGGPAGRAESLNASIAAAIICYEIRRQHPV